MQMEQGCKWYHWQRGGKSMVMKESRSTSWTEDIDNMVRKAFTDISFLSQARKADGKDTVW